MTRETSKPARKLFSDWDQKSAFLIRATKRSLPIWCGSPQPCAIKMDRENHPLWRMHPERWLETLVGAKHRGSRRPPAVRLSSIAGSGVFGSRPRDDRYLGVDPRGPPHGNRTQSRRGYPPASTRTGLLVARGLAPAPQRIPEVRIFSGARSYLARSRCCCWLRQRCTFIHPPTQFCDTSRPRLNGNCLASTSIGESGCASYSASVPAISANQAANQSNQNRSHQKSA